MSPQDIVATADKGTLLALLQTRRLPEAKALGETLCREQPQDAEAWQLLGVVHGSLGESEAAEGCFRRAIELRPELIEARFNLASLLEARGQLEQAATNFQAVLKLNPQRLPARQRLASLLTRQGRYAEAEAEYREVVRLKPCDAEAHYNLANVFYRQGKFAEAETSYRTALQAKPGFAEACNNLGILYSDQGRLAEAVTCFDRAVRIKPDHAGAHANLGDVLKTQGSLAEAEACYRQALRFRPDYVAVHTALGALYSGQGRLAEAEACYRQALRLDPTLVEAHINLGILLSDQDRPDEAVTHFEKALRVKHDYPDAYYNLGLVRARTGETEKAIENYKTALRLNPGFAEAHHNLGLAYVELGRFPDAEVHYRHAIRLKPDYSASYANLALVELAQGRFHDGWRHYIRYPNLRCTQALTPPAFLLGDLAWRRILLTCEQGLGDELFFLRFVPQLKAHGTWVAYRPNPRLASMLARVKDIDRIVASGETLDDIAYSFSTELLPLLLGMDDTSKIPAPLRLMASAERVEPLRNQLTALGAPPYIGVTWRAGTKNKNISTHDHEIGAAMLRLHKEAPMELLADALRDWPGTVLVLQRRPLAGEVEAFSEVLGRPAHDLSAVNEDLEQMLALLALLDDYVGVSNTNIHLRAGLGKTARVLVPHPPEWRWMTAGEESPWFKGLAVYRQGVDRDWDGAFVRLRQDLLRAFPSA